MKNKLITKACTNLQKVTYKARKHSPEILIVTGVIGIVGSAIWACVNTTKVGDVLDEAKEKIDDIHAEAEEAAEKEEMESVQPDEKIHGGFQRCFGGRPFRVLRAEGSASSHFGRV